MFNFSGEGRDFAGYSRETVSSSEVALFVSKVYNWMLAGLSITALVSYIVLMNENLMQIFIANPFIYIVLALFEIGLVIYLSSRLEKMTLLSAMVSFAGFSFLNGLTLSMILYGYATVSIAEAFLATAATFGALAVFGYTTKRDLSALGTFLFIALIGLIIASIVNIFLSSSAFHTVISYIGILIFAGLTAYDSQRIKSMAVSMRLGKEVSTKFAIIGALALYLDFINMFIYMLQIFGRRD